MNFEIGQLDGYHLMIGYLGINIYNLKEIRPFNPDINKSTFSSKMKD